MKKQSRKAQMARQRRGEKRRAYRKLTLTRASQERRAWGVFLAERNRVRRAAAIAALAGTAAY